MNRFHSENIPIFSGKVILGLACVLIATLVIDSSIGKVYYFGINQPSFSSKIIVFGIIVSICIVGQYFTLEYVRSRSREIRVLHLSSLHRAVAITQYALSAMLVLVILQIVFTARYQLLVLTAVVGVSYLLATILMGLLAKRFLLWHRTNKNFIVLLYGLASASIAVNTLSTFSYLTIILSEQPAYVLQHTGFVSPYFVVSLTTAAISNTYSISSIVSFMLSWAATSLLIRQYYPKISTIKYWIILLIPLAYFLFQFQPLFLNIFSGLITSQPVVFSILYTLIFTASKPVGGLIFASVFLNMARRIPRKKNLKSYLIMSALGFILLFVSNQAIVLASAPYPPFGLATVSFVGLSTYLIFVGIYSSAISVAQDAELRKIVRTTVKEEFDLLRNIGTSQLEEDIQQKVTQVTTKLSQSITQRTGIEPSLMDDDIKDYCKEVLQEIRKK